MRGRVDTAVGVGLVRSPGRQELRAFRALYDDHYGFVWSTVRRFGVRPDAVDDAVQDAFLVAFRRWAELPDGQPRAWLYGIARRVSSNARRSERRRRRKHDALGSVTLDVEGAGRLEASAELERFAARLDPGERELFVLGIVEGLRGRELACALQARPSTVYDRLRRLKQRLRAEVGEHAEADAQRARKAVPRASAAGWAVLLPRLGAAPGGLWLWPGLVGAAVVSGAVVFGAVGSAEPPRAVLVRRSVSLGVPEPVAVAAPVVRPLQQVPGPSTTPPPAPRPTRPTRARRRSKPAADPLQAEATLVRSLRAQVSAGRFAEAMRLVERHGREFADGALGDAVAALHVEALCQAGQEAAARTQATALLRARPGTPVARRLSQGCRFKKITNRSDEPSDGGHGNE